MDGMGHGDRGMLRVEGLLTTARIGTEERETREKREGEMTSFISLVMTATATVTVTVKVEVEEVEEEEGRGKEDEE